MNTSATGNATKSARLRVKLAGGAAGLAFAGVVLAACSVTSAGTLKSPTSAGAGQYHQAVYAASTTSKLSERDQLRAEHPKFVVATTKLGGTPGDSQAQLRNEHLGVLVAAPKLGGTPGDSQAQLRKEHLAS